MNYSVVDRLVNAVLYEGYILYPYRPSARKNQQRFTFGRVYPQAYSTAQNGAEPCVMQTQCLLQRQGDAPAVEVTVRFLHPMAREVGALPDCHTDGESCAFEVIPELRVDGHLYYTWQEVVERQIAIPPLSLDAPVYQATFSFPASYTMERIRGSDGQIAGGIRRRQCALAGSVEVTAEAVDERVSRITVRILNQTPVPEADLENQEAIVMRTFASTHTILHAQESEFLSLIDPPPQYAEAAAACVNVGTWPVLVGDERRGEHDTLLSSPIILYDYPQIAPESPGDLFDGGEIDEILTLRIMTMTDDEKLEMRHVDEHARRILQRTETLPEDHLLKLHGVMRPTASLDEEFFNPTKRLASVLVDGVELRAGGRVRIRPKNRADAMDLMMVGRIAVIEAVEQDAEERVHLALVLEDDPGKDLGMLRQPGHRFFYAPEEVEPLREEN